MRDFPTGGEIIDENRGGLIGKPQVLAQPDDDGGVHVTLVPGQIDVAT